MEERAYGQWTFEEQPGGELELQLPRRGRRRPPWWQRRGAWVAAGAVVLAGAGVGVGLALGSHGSGTAPAASTDTSSQVHVWGTLVISGFDFIDTQNPTDSIDGDTCKAVSGYDDIAEGTAVVVGGPTGQVGVGALGPGKVSSGDCSFEFDVSAPSGLSVYTVTVSHRGTQTFSPDELQGGIHLSLGN